MIVYNFIPVSNRVFLYRTHVDSSFYNRNGHPVKICSDYYFNNRSEVSNRGLDV